MPTSDAFTAQLVELIRRLPDDALLALVKNQLGLVSTAAAVPARAPSPKPARKPARKPAAPKPAAPKPAAPKPAAPKPAAPKPAPKPAAPKPAAPKPAAPKPAAPKPALKAAPAKAAPKPAPKPAAKPAPKPAAKPAAKPAKPAARGAGPSRDAVLASVERIVKSHSGLAVSQIAKEAGLPLSRATSAIKDLKAAKRIFQGGDRRFARYAGDPRTAEQASLTARRTAPGPIIKPAKKK